MKIIHIVLAQKPFKGNFISNVMSDLPSGLNVDRCRIVMSELDFRQYKAKRETFNGNNGRIIYTGYSMNHATTKRINVIETKGRHPSNIILDNDFSVDFDTYEPQSMVGNEGVSRYFKKIIKGK